MLRKLTLLLIAAAAFCQTTQIAPEPPPKPYDVVEAYEVYSAVLASRKINRTPLIAEDTVPFHHCMDPDSDKEVDSAINNYKKANETRWRLQQLDLSKKYKLISTTEIEQMKSSDPKAGLFWRFPKGIEIARLSTVGFNADKTLAFLEMDTICGGACGQGHPYILQKRNGKWQEYDPPPVRSPDGSFSFHAECGWNY
jgi:hypothetical protein